MRIEPLASDMGDLLLPPVITSTVTTRQFLSETFRSRDQSYQIQLFDAKRTAVTTEPSAFINGKISVWHHRQG